MCDRVFSLYMRIFHILSGYCKSSHGDTQIVEMCGFGCADFINLRNFLDMFYPKKLKSTTIYSITSRFK